MENKAKRRLIIIIILIVIIVILLLRGCSSLETGKEIIGNNEKVNVFDMNVNVNYIQYVLDANGNIISQQENMEPFDASSSGENIISNHGVTVNGTNSQSGANENVGQGPENSSNSDFLNSGDDNNANNVLLPNEKQSGDIVPTVIPSGEEKQVRDKNGFEIPIYDYNKDKEEEMTGKVYVDDKNGDFMYQQNLDIFRDSMYANRQKIAPGSTNVYQFVVHNSSNKNANYRIEMKDRSQYPVNMKYRLKRENTYVIGSENEWVSAEELKTQYVSLAKGKQDKYYLDWKWFHDDENDTLAGANMTSAYQLSITVFFNIDEK